jgi:cytochrome c oxidase cbb3-type subunit 3
MAEGGKTAANAGTRPAGVEVDPVTGQETTGHVWDGIRELNRPLPRWWLWIYATIIWARVTSSLPGHTLKGTEAFGYSTRASVEDARQAAGAGGRLEKVATLPLEDSR